ncbi:MAG: DUF1501 domain-containing protein [Pirellulaceae bacterium]|jgi:hypothetical protein|nr:DUF1501 domain-containing protein [Pirellulaceae bacterium]MDP7016989.1 DUF1501 domain-containing protein [Pirellulaceae bacterium]
MSRREVLRVGGLAAGGLGLADLLMLRSLQGAGKARAFGRAKRILLLYLQGAASQLDTWDPKPDAPAEVRGQWGVTSTSVPGIQICEKLPKLAKLMDRISIVRSMTHDYNNHSNAYTLTGHPTVDFSSETNPFDDRHHPFFASVLDYLADHSGQSAHVDRQVPRNIGLPFRFSTYSPVFRRAGPYGAFLGNGYDPVWTEFDGQATKTVNRVSFFSRLKGVNVKDPFCGITPASRLRVSKDVRLRPSMSFDRFTAKRNLAEQFDSQNEILSQSAAARGLDRFQQMALSLMNSTELRTALDVGREPMSAREQYGMTLFGQAALTGRRLLEAGAQLVSVFWDEYKVVNTAWDTHFNHFSRLGDELLPGFDAAVSSLLTDLEQRGMLDDTLVLCLTEHGRTPQVKTKKTGGGRDHWSKAYSVMMAGAGVRAGYAHGASDGKAAFVTDRPLSPEDVLATMYHIMGIDHTTTVPDRLNRPVRLVAEGGVVDDLLS